MSDRGLMQRYVFPDGELQEIGHVVTAIRHAGLEVRHTENLREHYALILRAWMNNLERAYPQAVAMVGGGRARVWRLYLASSALSFEHGKIEVHQTFAVRPGGDPGILPLCPAWESIPLTDTGRDERQHRQSAS